MPKLTFQSDVSWSGEGVRSIAQIGDRQVVIDEPKSLGGTDQGPNPVEYLLAALGGCISILVSMFADRHKVEDRKSTRLNSSHVRISYAVFCLKKKMIIIPKLIALNRF